MITTGDVVGFTRIDITASDEVPLFDANRYDHEVLRPLRGTHGHLPEGDLLTRYAIDSGMDAIALHEHLRMIRQWWEQRAQAPDFRAAVCKLLIQADIDLQMTVGAAMEDPAWWHEQARLSSAVTQPEPVEDAVIDPVTAGPTAARDWRADARAQFWSALGALDRATTPAGADRPVPLPREHLDESEPAEPEQSGLRVEPVDADGDVCRVRLTWPGTSPGGVRARFAAEFPPFASGSAIAWTEAQSWGRELSGTTVRESGRTALTATVPTGYHVYLLFEEVSGELVRAGRPVALGVADTVQQLRLERDGVGAALTWVWPGGATAVDVEWTSGATTDRFQVTRSQYTTGRGVAVADARAGGQVRVRALTPVGGGTAHSPAVTAAIGAAPVEVVYDLERRRRVSGSELMLTLTADRTCAGLEVDVVVSIDDLMPLDAGAGEVHARLGPLQLEPGEPLRHVLPWPQVPRSQRPFWICCFFHAPYPVSATDPQIDHMRF